MYRHERLNHAARIAIHKPAITTLGVSAQPCFNARWRQVVGLWIDVAEQRARAEPGNRARRRKERIRRGDNFVARAYVQRHECNQQRVGSR